ncbi:hypothetical protein PGT21_016444 [Puccinia graminis f. sp. tritici]|uniref:Uncharacterized protein n=1 Tax=Puccinia graminis f. sp. tritici TaxID=56615 RepID=A0A5B0Q5R4_PUCGR|nr:hypothetical protein PGT21_016444 [Puccinia graminis f. sp. tritici]
MHTLYILSPATRQSPHTSTHRPLTSNSKSHNRRVFIPNSHSQPTQHNNNLTCPVTTTATHPGIVIPPCQPPITYEPGQATGHLNLRPFLEVERHTAIVSLTA